MGIVLLGLGLLAVAVLVLTMVAGASAASNEADTTAAVQILFCDLEGEASLIDCVTMHEIELGAFTLPSATPLSLVATDASENAKAVLRRWADDGCCVVAGFSYLGDTTHVRLSTTDAALSLGLVGALG